MKPPPARRPLPLLPALLASVLVMGSHAKAQIDFAPPNDLFASRTDLGSGETAEVRQQVLRSSSEFGDPLENSIWWQWTAPREGWWEVQMNPDSAIFSYNPVVQVYLGGSLESLITAPDGALAPSQPSPTRRLFHAAQGQPVQIGVSNPYPPFPDIHFALRPATIATNTSLDTRQSLQPLNGTAPDSPWGGNGWSVAVTAPPFITPSAKTFHAPLFWEWTCPADGSYAFVTQPIYTSEPVAVAAFRNREVSASGEIRDDFHFAAKAGESFLFVTGSEYQAAGALKFHELQVVPTISDTGPPSNSGNPYIIPAALPVTVSPPTNAPHSSELWWLWNCQYTGWIEFDGGSLIPVISGVFPNASIPPILPAGGRRYFWVVPGTYWFAISGWQWPVVSSFTLSKTSPAAPPNDSIAKATDLGSGRTASTSGTLLGATRELGDPPAPPSNEPQTYAPQPTVWHRWQPAGGKGTAEVHLTWSPDEWLDIANLRVFSGADPAFFTELPVVLTDSDPFGPPHFQFPINAVGGTYYLCLTGRGLDYSLNANLNPAGYTGDNHPNTSVTDLKATGSVSEAVATLVPANTNLFKWTAPADGAFTWLTNAISLKVTTGRDIRVQYVVYENAANPQPTAVKAGDVYWFRPLPDEVSAGKPVTSRLRLMFKPDKAPIPGDTAGTAISLGSQLPVQTACPIFSTTFSNVEELLIRPALNSRITNVLWYSWTAPEDADGVEIHAPSLITDVFADSAQGPRVAISNPDTSDGDVFFVPQAGRTYFIMVQSPVWNPPGDKMLFTMRRYLTPPASNDDFARATPVQLSNRVLVARYGDSDSRYRFSAQQDEPLPDPAQSTLNRSAWWRWTAPDAGIYRVICPIHQPTDSGGILDSTRRAFASAVYQVNGTGFPGLTRVSGILAANHPDTTSWASWFGTGADRSFAFRAEAGKEYVFQVASAEEFGGLSMALLPGDAYDIWSLSHAGMDAGQSGPDDNPSGDGMNNLLKFCLGLNPALTLDSDPAASRAPSWNPSPDGSALHYTFWSDRFNTGWQMPFPANGSQALANTARLVAERSSDLVNWTPVTDAESLGDNRWRVTLPMNGTQSKRFVRLRAEWVMPSWPQ